jgi:pilus assembly protein CpaE
VDETARLVCDLSTAVLIIAQTDVVSLWSAGRMLTFLQEGGARERVRLVLNRYKKIPGFSDEDVEKATNGKLLWKIPNSYQTVAPSIDKGTPVAMQENQEVSRSFRALAATLAEAPTNPEGSLDFSYQVSDPEFRKRASRTLLISPVRAGQ